jgi:ATP-binding cassette, subfamily C (CFTR/MRP), member 1
MKIIQKLANLQNEKTENEKGTLQVEKSWPSQGNVQFKDLELRYRPTTDRVLNGLTLNIKAGDKVGVVGRTGAGKSTLGLTLLKMMEADSGTIQIDGVDISKVDLQTLRDKVTIIP